MQTFAICPVKIVSYISDGKAATRNNSPVNMSCCFKFQKDKGLADNDGNGHYEKDRPAIYFHLGKTEERWFFATDEERDLTYETLCHTFGVNY